MSETSGQKGNLVQSLVFLVLGAALGAGGMYLVGAGSLTGGGGDPVVAKLGSTSVRASEAFSTIAPRISELEAEIYRTKSQAIDNIIETRLLDEESKKQNLTVAQLLEKETGGSVGEVDDEEVATFLASKNLSLDDPRIRKDDVKDYIKYQRRFSKREGFVSKLKDKANVKILLERPVTPKLAVTTDGYPTWGNASAPVTVVEFSDYQCPFCSRAVPTLNQIKKEYGPDKIRIVFRDLPLPSHDRAKPASLAAHCANEQGKFWEYHDMLFENQDSLSDENLKEYAERLEMDGEAFSSCYTSKKHEALVNQSVKEAEALGIRATPSFVINGELLQGAQDVARFKEVIDRGLNPKS